MQPKILVFSGSTRSGSHNTRLAGTIVREMSLIDCEVTRISLEDYPLPIYNGDDEAANGIPENATRLARHFVQHDGCFIVSPEYNGSLTPLLKNTIDWISRVKSVDGKETSPFKDKVCAIAAASPGAMGGISMLYHLREILVRLGMLVISEQVAVGNAAKAFDNMDNLTDDRAAGFLKTACSGLAYRAKALKVD